MGNLVRRNGTGYTMEDDLVKTITGTLYGSKFFEKDTVSGTWTMNGETAATWEAAMLNRIDEKKPWAQKANTGVNNNTLTSMNFLNKTPVYNKPHPAFIMSSANHNQTPGIASPHSNQVVDTDLFLRQFGSHTKT